MSMMITIVHKVWKGEFDPDEFPHAIDTKLVGDHHMVTEQLLVGSDAAISVVMVPER